MNKKVLFTIVFPLVVLVAGFLFGVGKINAQEIRPILTWQAMNFYPSNYQGKAFPTDGTPIVVSATFIKDGVVVSPENIEIRWLVDRSLHRRGSGLSEITINSRGISGSHQVAVEATINGVFIRETIIVPKKSPLVAIEAPYPVRLVWAPPIVFRAVPYFFNASSLSDLNFSWAVNGATTRSGDNTLLISAEHPAFVPGRAVGISVTANNSKNSVERAKSSMRINVME